MKKRKLRKPRKLWGIAECRSDGNGRRWIKINVLPYQAWFSSSGNVDKIAKWFSEAKEWVSCGK